MWLDHQKHRAHVLRPLLQNMSESGELTRTGFEYGKEPRTHTIREAAAAAGVVGLDFHTHV